MDVLWLGILLALYVLPALVAYDRGHHQRSAILVLNVLAAWTILGWTVALVWACTRVEHREVAI